MISDGYIPFQHQIPAWAPERPEQTFKTTVFPVASAGAIFHETITYNSTGMSADSSVSTCEAQKTDQWEIPRCDGTLNCALTDSSMVLHPFRAIDSHTRQKVHVVYTPSYFLSSRSTFNENWSIVT